MNLTNKWFLIGVLACLVDGDETPEHSTENQKSSNDTNEIVISENITLNNDHKEDQLTEKSNKTHKFVQCLRGQVSSPVVQLTNDTELIKLIQSEPKVTDRDGPALCILVLFYSKYCPFSAMAAPHFNALPRAYPDIKMVAINAVIYRLFNTQNGIVGVPSLMLFHNGRSIAKFNGSEYTLENFSQFLTKYTGIPAVEKTAVTSADFAGPVTNVPAKDYDIFLILSWLFIILCGGYYFTRSKWWTWIVETIQSNWRESEAQAQHEHVD